jgi:septal ring-binding cell division protein DamX
VPVPTTTATHIERTAAGAATITNSPQPAAAAAPRPDATRAKYDAMARNFATQQGGSYTIQFELVCETASVTRAIAEAGDKVWFIPTSYRGRPCYRVFWGRFNSSAEASAASKQLPRSLGATPVVVKIPR